MAKKEGRSDIHADIIKINAEVVSTDKLRVISNAVIGSEILTFKRDALSFIKRTPIKEDNYFCRPILPGSGNHLTVRINSESRYTLTTTINNNIDGLSDNSKHGGKRKVTVSGQQGAIFLRSLRLSQMIIVAFSKRLESEVKVNVPHELIELIASLEGIVDGEVESYKDDLERTYLSLLKTYKYRIEQLYGEFEKLVEWLDERGGATKYDFSSDDIILGQGIENAFFDYSEDSSVNYGYYLGSVKPNKHNIQYVRDSVRFALKEIFLPSEWLDPNEEYSGGIQKEYPLPKLIPHNVEDDLYGELISNCGPILDVLKSKVTDDPENGKLTKGVQRCNDLMSDLEAEITMEKLVKKPPSKLQKELDDITIEFELYGQMQISLKNSLPGLFETLDQDDKENFSLQYQKSSNVRFDISSCKQIIIDVRNLIREKSSAKDIQHQTQSIEQQGREFQSSIQKITHKPTNLQQLEEKISILKKEMLNWKSNVEEQLSRVSSDDSLLWIGLGQAGGQILRECMMYCLENLNDARCTALLRALGVNKEDQAVINNLIKQVHSPIKEKSKEAEMAIKQIAHDNLHILAINLGEEIDKLVLDDAPGYFIWGDDIEWERSLRVTRGKRNTLKLNTSGEGAGGRTGLGRAFGFKHHNEISDVMRDVGMNKGGRKPKHIVITHSFAGGSGSGMVLPVLQQVRRTFGGNAIIWVMSVGGGDAERKVASTFNTPFILSDILQAHYDGIHAITDPVKLSEWGNFKGSISRLRSAMNSDLEKLLDYISDSEGNDKGTMSRFEQLIDHRHRNMYHDKKSRVSQAVKIINGYTKADFPYERPKGIGDYPSQESLDDAIDDGVFFSNLENILPLNIEETKGFNKWCEIQELEGLRPALDMWLNWIECETDILGYFIQGRERDKQTKADDIDGSVIEQQFIPSLTSDHLKTLLANVCLNINLEREEVKNVKKLPAGLIPLAHVLENSFSGTNEEKSNMYDGIKKLLTSYGSHLNQYNNLREKLTGQIMSLSGASSDARIKSIVVSNAHLELGVNTTQDLQVSGSTYTVYNSVIFDLMLNIIAPRLPTEPGVFINTDAEEFDEQDLLTHTHPPLVVGILNQRDSTSLSEPPLVADTTRHTLSSAIQKVLASILSRDVCGDIKNPLKAVDAQREELQMFFLSMFGRRYLYALQHNPYNGIVDTPVPESLSEFVMMVIEKWDSEDEVFGLSQDLRNNISFSEGITSEHVGNMIYWLSLIDIKSFAKMIARNAKEASQIEGQLESNGWPNMCPENPGSMDMQRYSIDSNLSKFIAQEKITLNEKIIMQVLPKIGIWNGSILRTVGASHLNSYLPIELLFYEGDGGIKIDDVNLNNIGIKREEEGQYRSVLKIVLEKIRENHGMGNNGYLLENQDLKLLVTNEVALRATNKMLEEVGLKLDYITDSKRLRLSLHPRVLRYFSAFRDIPMKPNDVLLPARSAGASLARYLHADSPGEVLDSSIPPSGISSPTFVKGGEILNYMRYFGLLPDEDRLSLVPLMRILLLGSGSSDEFKRRLASQAKLVGFDFEQISQYLVQILDEQKYEKLDIFNQPLAYCLQSEVIHNRLKITKLLAEQLSESPPKNWSSNDMLGLEAWLEITNNEDILLEFEGEEKLFGDDRESLSALKDWLHELRSLTGMNLSGNTIEEENLESSSGEGKQKETVSGGNSTIIAIKQLFFDISSTLSESIGQAEYMNREFDSRRVHFEMTGFSDRLMGIPDSLLLLIHDRSPKLEQDAIKLSVREGIEYSVGSLGDPKEYFTAADYGPTSCITMVFQRAPLASLVDEFKAALEDKQSGLSSRDPNKYQDITRLHPYIFLYNLLWLSVKIDKWTSALNTDFIRSFQIPTKVIEQHYQNPSNIPSSVLSIETHESYRLGKVRMPQDDQRDFKNAMNIKERGVRNIVPLIGLMALRHEEAGGYADEQYWKVSGLTEKQYKDLNHYSGHEKSYLANKIYLNPKDPEDEGGAGDDSELAGLLAGLTSGNPESKTDDKDDLESRTKAWFKAYSNWLNFTGEEEVDLGSKTDDASLFNAGE